jgi:hypothetical protein
MKLRHLSLAALAIAGLAATIVPQQASAQTSRPPIEFSATYGSMWGGNIETTLGKLRTATGGALGLALDVPMQPGMWIEASYTRQDGALDWDPRGGTKVKLTDMSVNHWHLGTVRALVPPSRGGVMPYVTGSLGATYMSPSSQTVEIGNETYNIDSTTKFSIAFGLGFKAYVGQAQKIGLRGSFKVFSTLYDSGGGVFFGPGGVQLGVSGSGIWQYEAAGGITVKFGG